MLASWLCIFQMPIALGENGTEQTMDSTCGAFNGRVPGTPAKACGRGPELNNS